MHLAELTPPEQRVLGCLIEKRWTTPDQYPLSLNSLRLACNQSTNRDPVTAYDEATVREAAQRLCLYGLARLASGQGSRAVKYRHLAEEALGLDREELGLLAVLLLRGPQTPGELKARSERLAPLESLADVERVLRELGERGYARRLERRPGQKEDRFEHLLGARRDADAPSRTEYAPARPEYASERTEYVPARPESASERTEYAPARPEYASEPAERAAPAEHASAPAPLQPQASSPEPPAAQPFVSPAPRIDVDGALAERIATLESEVASLRAELDELRDLVTAPAAH